MCVVGEHNGVVSRFPGKATEGLLLLAAVALQVIHRIDRYEVVLYGVFAVHDYSAFFENPPKPRRAGAAPAVDVEAEAVAALLDVISSDLLTFTVDCSAWWRGFMCR